MESNAELRTLCQVAEEDGNLEPLQNLLEDIAAQLNTVRSDLAVMQLQFNTAEQAACGLNLEACNDILNGLTTCIGQLREDVSGGCTQGITVRAEAAEGERQVLMLQLSALRNRALAARGPTNVAGANLVWHTA